MDMRKITGPGSKSVDAETKEHIRSFLRDYVEREYFGNTQRAAEGLNISQSMVYELTNANKSAGLKTIVHLARKTGASLDEIVGLKPMSNPVSRDSRYPNRGIAAQAAKALGVNAKAIEDILAIRHLGADVPRDLDPSPRYWFERMRQRDLELRDSEGQDSLPGSPLPLALKAGSKRINKK